MRQMFGDMRMNGEIRHPSYLVDDNRRKLIEQQRNFLTGNEHRNLGITDKEMNRYSGMKVDAELLTVL